MKENHKKVNIDLLFKLFFSEIAEITGVSEPTIRNCVKDLEQEKELILPAKLLEEARIINPDYGDDNEEYI